MAIVFILISFYFCARFYLLKNSLKKAERELREIQRNISKNRGKRFWKRRMWAGFCGKFLLTTA